MTVVVGFARPAAHAAGRDPERRASAGWWWSPWRCCSPPRCCRRCSPSSAGRSTGRAGWRAGSPGTTRRRRGRSGPAACRGNPVRALAIGGTIIALLTAPVFWIRIGLPSRNWWPTATEAGQGVADAGPDGRRQHHPAGAGAGGGAGGPDARSSAASLRGLRALSDSLRADPPGGAGPEHRGPGARDVASCEYSMLYSDLADARRAVRRLPRRLPEHATSGWRWWTWSCATPPASPPAWTSRARARALAARPTQAAARARPSWSAATPRPRSTCRTCCCGASRMLVFLILACTGADARDRVPLGAGADQGRDHEHPLGQRHLRADRAGVPVRLRGGGVRARRADLGDLRGGAGAGLRGGVRAQHGLRGVPAGPGQGGVRQDRATTTKATEEGLSRHGLGDHLARR